MPRTARRREVRIPDKSNQIHAYRPWPGRESGSGCMYCGYLPGSVRHRLDNREWVGVKVGHEFKEYENGVCIRCGCARGADMHRGLTS